MHPVMGLGWIAICCFCIFFVEITNCHVSTYIDPALGGDTTDDDIDKYEDCIADHLRRNPELIERFNEYQLAKACKRYESWHKNYPSPSNYKPTNYTHLQKKYIDRIQYCRNYDDCYGDTRIDRTGRNKQKRQSGNLAVRRECRTMSEGELQSYFNTLNILKNTLIDGQRKYDLLIAYHLPEAAPEAHFGPGFLPYHRELLKQLEVAGRRENPSFALCYWDSTLDQGLPSPVDSVLWTDYFFGAGNGDVVDGPFANWRVTADVPGSHGRIYRLLGRANTGALYKPSDISGLMAASTYTQFCNYCSNPSFETLHAGVHDFVGGHMTYIPASPNDPVFFNHHCFIDYFWEVWRNNRQQGDIQTDYPPNNACANKPQHNANSPMSPFNTLRIIDGLSESYSALYTYEPSPTCGNGECGGSFLFCNTDSNRCMSKVRMGGNCRGLENFDSCYNSVCIGGVCGTGARRPQSQPDSQDQEQPRQQPQQPPAQRRQQTQPQQSRPAWNPAPRNTQGGLNLVGLNTDDRVATVDQDEDVWVDDDGGS